MQTYESSTSHAACRPGRLVRLGFTLTELPVVIGMISIVPIVLMAIAAERRMQAEADALSNLLYSFEASADFYAANGEAPSEFSDLQPYMSPSRYATLSSAYIDGMPLFGSIYQMESDNGTVRFLTLVDNYMLTAQTHVLEATSKQLSTRQAPPIVTRSDQAALEQFSAAMREMEALSINAVICVASAGGEDLSEDEAKLMLAHALKEPEVYQTARGILDRNGDGKLSRSEIFDTPWYQTIGVYGECFQTYTDLNNDLQIFDPSEADYSVRFRYMPGEDAVLERLRQQVALIQQSTNVEHLQLDHQLDQVSKELRMADFESASQRMRVVERQLGVSIDAGKISLTLGGPARELATFLGDLIALTLALPLDPEWPYPGSIDLYVAQDGNADATGTAEDPFGSTVEALAFAEEISAPAVTLHVGMGRYVGALDITRPTRMIGAREQVPAFDDYFDFVEAVPTIEGVLLNTGPYEVKLEHLRFTSQGTIPGGIVIVHPEASTYLANVRIRDAVGVGLLQSGGELRCSGVEIARTKAYSAVIAGDPVRFGVGMQLEQVEADLQGVTLLENVGASLVMLAATVDADGLSVYRTRPDPAVTSAPVALQVRNSTQFRGKRVVIGGGGENQAGDSFGIYADENALVVLEHSLIHDCYYGVGSYSGNLIMSSFTIYNGGCAIIVGGDAELNGDSKIYDCKVAYCLLEGDASVIGPGIVLENNEANIRTTRLPIPEVVSPVPPLSP